MKQLVAWLMTEESISRWGIMFFVVVSALISIGGFVGQRRHVENDRAFIETCLELSPKPCVASDDGKKALVMLNVSEPEWSKQLAAGQPVTYHGNVTGKRVAPPQKAFDHIK